MKHAFLGMVLFFNLAQGQTDSSSNWKHYGRIGVVDANSTNGGFSYYRINRQTKASYRDLRLFGYELEDVSFIYLRYKSSEKYSLKSKFYRYTITSLRKNTQVNMNLQYHFNQGIGYFIKKYKNGLFNIEGGHGFDMSDYLNETRKTSYIKAGIFWDHENQFFSTKVELEHFQQISEVVINDLSRNQYLFEIIFPIKNGAYFNINYEKEDLISKGQADASSVTFAIGWTGNLKWEL